MQGTRQVVLTLGKQHAEKKGWDVAEMAPEAPARLWPQRRVGEETVELIRLSIHNPLFDSHEGLLCSACSMSAVFHAFPSRLFVSSRPSSQCQGSLLSQVGRQASLDISRLAPNRLGPVHTCTRGSSSSNLCAGQKQTKNCIRGASGPMVRRVTRRIGG